MWTTILAASLAAMTVWILADAALRARPLREKGTRCLDWPLGMKAVSVAFLLTGPVVVWMALSAPESQRVPATLMALLFAFGPLYVGYCVFLYRVTWTAHGLESRHPLGTRRIDWADVASGGYSPLAQAFHVTGKDGTRIWYSPMQAGAQELNRFMARRLRPAASGATLPPVAGSAG
jgi:hypothetical protein